MGALLDLASFDEQPMEVAPSFDPEGKLQEIVQMEASSPMELLSDIWHVVQRGLLLNTFPGVRWSKKHSLARAHSASLKGVCTVCL